MDVAGLYWWQINIGSGDVLVSSGSPPLLEPILNQISVVIWRLCTTMGWMIGDWKTSCFYRTYRFTILTNLKKAGFVEHSALTLANFTWHYCIHFVFCPFNQNVCRDALQAEKMSIWAWNWLSLSRSSVVYVCTIGVFFYFITNIFIQGKTIQTELFYHGALY